MIVSMVFLLTIIGWAPLLAGLAAFSITIPPNVWSVMNTRKCLSILMRKRLSKNFQAQQQKLMKARDQKLAIVTEALQGIRQVR